jgi:hypothetical protein
MFVEFCGEFGGELFGVGEAGAHFVAAFFDQGALICMRFPPIVFPSISPVTRSACW